MKFLLFSIVFLFVGIPNMGDCNDLQCFISGECTNSQDVDTLPSNDEFQCLESCQKIANCTWFSFFPDSSVCHLMSSCGNIEDTFCPNCVSGQKECDNPTPVCFVKGNFYNNIVSLCNLLSQNTNVQCLINCYIFLIYFQENVTEMFRMLRRTSLQKKIVCLPAKIFLPAGATIY